ncbi:MAG: hypothetical protein ACXVUL_09850 [Solirubrobacteraceae bacterium]
MHAVARRAGVASAIIAVLALLAACGSGSVAQKAENVASTATGAVKGKLAAATTTTTTETVTQPAETVTEPARTRTVTRTETTTVPGKTTSIQSNTTSVQVSPTTATSGKQSSGGIPSWGWVLIGAGAALLVVAIFMIGRARGAPAREARGEAGPSRPPDSAMPPRGPPEDPI